MAISKRIEGTKHGNTRHEGLASTIRRLQASGFSLADYLREQAEQSLLLNIKQPDDANRAREKGSGE